MKRKMFLQKIFHPIVTIKDGNDPDQCRRLTLFDAFQVVVNDKNVLFLILISHQIAHMQLIIIGGYAIAKPELKQRKNEIVYC